ncbi:ABC transporter ATP-binding protein/permease [Candidatus Pelagibacter sp.]|nr:ABC transporter ATP-binding protein/permease [Candidatus Pelagibacter sp.]
MISKIIYIVEKKFFFQIFFLFFLLIISTFLELISIGSIPIFLMAISDVDQFFNKLPFLNNFKYMKLDDSMNLIYFVSFVIIIVFFLKNLFLFFSNYYQGKLRKHIREDIKEKVLKTYLFMPYKFHLNFNPSLLVRNITHDSIHASDVLFIVITILKELILLLLLLLVLIFSTPSNTLLLIILLSLISYVFYFFVRKIVKKAGIEYRQSTGFELKNLLQSFGSIKETKILSRENYFLNLVKFNIKNIEDSKFISGLISSVPKLVLEVVTISSITFVLILYFNLGYEFNQILPSITLYVVCALRMIPAFNTITTKFTIFKLHSISLNAIYKDLKDNKLTIESTNSLKETDDLKEKINKILIKNISFGHEKNSYTLKNISMSILAGEKIGILGKSGSGKSTFVDLLLGLHLPNEGSILINNHNIKDNFEYWRNKVGFIPQNLYLFDDTIVSNITYGLLEKDVDYKKFNYCLKISNLLGFVNNLKDKEKTLIGNNGIRISGGEKQRIGIARALYNLPELLIFDESTSALDSNNESLIMNEIDNLDYKCTKIIISHKLGPLLNCDKIYVFDNGRIIHSGSLEEVKNNYII